MEIICPKILLVKGDKAISSIAGLFKPLDETAKAFLGEPLPYEGALTVDSDEETIAIKKIFAVCVAPKGETLQNVLVTLGGDWVYETLGGWYQYAPGFLFTREHYIFTPGTVYLDEKYNAWIPVVVRTTDDFMGELFMKEGDPSRKFSTERMLLISRNVKM